VGGGGGGGGEGTDPLDEADPGAVCSEMSIALPGCKPGNTETTLGPCLLYWFSK